jgi:Raf kinase inhibitor-like YbhB/YbcL family protein
MKKILFCILILGLGACVAQPMPTNAPVPASAPALTDEPISPTETEIPLSAAEEVTMAFEISSPAFTNGGPIPPDFSCDGSDTSPAFTWTKPPAGTQSFSLIMDDPDAPMKTWVHWVVFNIPASVRGLAEGTPTDPQLGDGSLQGKTSAGSNGYHGPCPPSGTHRYFFKLYALDNMLSLSANANQKELLATMEGHILANAELMGTFSH